MRLKFLGNIAELMDGIEIMSNQLGFEISEAGIPITVESNHSHIEVILENGAGLIKFDQKIHFFRALGLFVENNRQKKNFKIVEDIQFQTNGAMFDVSRNAVLTVNSVQKLIEKMALMGLNLIMLYTEDTYTISEKPYFGYMRGRYNYDELKEIDDYANIFGMEVVPCIQTLAHLTEALKWSFAAEIQDTKDILLVGNDKTYEFIEEMIRAASKPFRSKRIHIGMDEAHNLGLGKYLDINGYEQRFEIMNRHLKKVVDITLKHGLEPIIWSDMYFRLGSKTGAYYDLNSVIPEDVKQKVPKEVKLVFWDYYHENEEIYCEFLKKHKSFGSEPIFAGAVWTSAGIIVNYKKTFNTANVALRACKKQNIKEVIATMWGNDGAETNLLSGLLGLQLYAEHGYSKELDIEKLKRRFEFCTGGKYDDFMALSNFDDLQSLDSAKQNNFLPKNPSKYLLWQDILIGLFDKNIEGIKLNEYYSQLEKRMLICTKRNGEWNFIFKMPLALCSVLSLKSELGIKIKKYYDENNLYELTNIVNNVLPELKKRVINLATAHREQWFITNKSFGWEILDVRYGGLLSRIDTASKRISDYVLGKIKMISELEEERLTFDGYINEGNSKIVRCNEYTKILSANPFGWRY